MNTIDGQLDIYALLEPEPPTVDFDSLTGWTLSEPDPDRLDAIASAWGAAYKDLPHAEWRMFPGWRESMTGRNAMGTPHPSFIYTASLHCGHWRTATRGDYQTGCQCVGKDSYYRAYCAGCEWWTPVVNSENEAAESYLDHCWEGWRELPVIEAKQNATYGYDYAFPKDYPAEWQVPGAPHRDCRGMTVHGTRHVPSGSEWGGYKTAAIQECQQHHRK